jgi:hypothetical protein
MSKSMLMMFMVMMVMFLSMIIDTSDFTLNSFIAISKVSLSIISIWLMHKAIMNADTCFLNSLSLFIQLCILPINNSFSLSILTCRNCIIRSILSLLTSLGMIIYSTNNSFDRALSIGEVSLSIISIWLMNKTVVWAIVSTIICNLSIGSSFCLLSFYTIICSFCLFFFTG